MEKKIFNYQYKFCLLKRYFDTGYGLTSPIKYLILLFGVTTQDVATTLVTVTIYGLLCFILGYVWFKTNFIRAEVEVGNRFNYFVQEMRETIVNKGRASKGC